MLEGLRTAAAGMRAQQTMLDAVSNDLANANTNGYKRVRVGFGDLLYEQDGSAPAPPPPPSSTRGAPAPPRRASSSAPARARSRPGAPSSRAGSVRPATRS